MKKVQLVACVIYLVTACVLMLSYLRFGQDLVSSCNAVIYAIVDLLESGANMSMHMQVVLLDAKSLVGWWIGLHNNNMVVLHRLKFVHSFNHQNTLEHIIIPRTSIRI